MRLYSSIRRLGAVGMAATVLAACGGGNESSSSATATPKPTPVPVVITKSDATHGTFLVAASNQMTLYSFTKDIANSSKSACAVGGCLTRWPALTVSAGTKPTGGAGVTGTLGTIVRTDNGATQVTYNGLPLYFFSKDTSPGDTTGVYPNWLLVKP